MKTIKSLTRLALFALGLSALAVGSAFAASNVTGYIQGDVSSTTDESLAGATVTISNEQTGVSRSITTDADGSYRFSALDIGTYTVTVSRSGYQDVSRQVDVNIGTGTDAFFTLLAAGEDATELGTVTVTGAVISPIDITSSESSLVVNEAEIDRIPVGRNLTDVALLAPTTVAGDPTFGNFASFGGSSVAENRCYINGLNVTNFRNGLGCNTVPFEFYQQFQVKTGGFSAKFGGVTGGVINAVTKSGTNEFHWGVNLYYQPFIEGLSKSGANVYTPSGRLAIHNKMDEVTDLDANIWASGPIIEDTLFYYVLYNPRKLEVDDYQGEFGSDEFEQSTSDDGFWGAKIDWNITDNHLLEITAFSDSRTTTTDTYDFTFNGAQAWADDGVIGAYKGSDYAIRGGENFIIKYTGYLTSNLTLSLMYGHNEYSLSNLTNTSNCPIAIDSRPTPSLILGCWTGQLVSTDNDERDAYRLDIEWFLGDHLIAAGIDKEENTANSVLQYSGDVAYVYNTVPAGTPLPNGATIPGGGDYVSARTFRNGGSFGVNSFAIYVEDQWQVTDNLSLDLGLRLPQYENLNAAGQTFIKIDGEVAPRLGAAWDVFGDASFKLYGTLGRYYLPIAGNTNVRLSGSEFDQTFYYTFTGIDPATGAPSGLTQVGPPITPADGTIPDPKTVLDSNFSAMYQDELIFGFAKDEGNGWVWGVKAVFRELPSAIDDITIDLAVQRRGLSPSVFNYVLANPGQAVTVFYDGDGDGTVEPNEQYTFTPEELGYPEPIRKYSAIVFDFERVWDGEWFLQGSYTWSHSYGNTEGYVKSDIGQDDAGVTQDFDFPALMIATYGDLPNDRRHVFKLQGAWQFAPHWSVGATMIMQSGRPINSIGYFPFGGNASLYENSFFYRNPDANPEFVPTTGDPDGDGTPGEYYVPAVDGEPGYFVPRGAYGTTQFLSQVDLSLDYTTEIGAGDLTLGVRVFNIFNAQNETQVNEFAEDGSGNDNDTWGMTSGYQQPRTIVLRAGVSF